MFSTRVGFYGGTAKQWYEYSNTEILAEITNWSASTASSVSTYNLTSSLHNANDKWANFVKHPNGKLYAAPGGTTSTAILEFDPVNLTAREISTGLTMSGAYRYFVGTLGNDGKLYWPPYNMDKTLVFDPVANVATLQTWNLTGMTGFNCIAKANGNIYAVGSRTDVLVINSTANTAAYNTFNNAISGTGTSFFKWGAAIRSVGNSRYLYLSPYNNTNCLRLDITNNTGILTTWGQSFGSQSSQGISNGKDGNVYITSHALTNIWRIDVTANTLTRVSTSGIRGVGGSLTNTGNILVTPYPTDTVSTGNPQLINVPGNTIISVSPAIQQRRPAVMGINGNTYILPGSTSNTHILIYNFGGNSTITSGMSTVVALSDYVV